MAKRTGIMLAHPLTEARLRKLPQMLYCQPKVDGFRCRAKWSSFKGWILYSSSARIITSVPHINNFMNDFLRKPNDVLGESLEHIDGELIVPGWSFQQVSSVVSKTVGLHPHYQQVELNVFDAVSKFPQSMRFTELENLFDSIRNVTCKPITRLLTEIIENDSDVITYKMSEYIEQGYEGIILRNPRGRYQTKKCNDLIKYKPRHEGTYRIVGVKEEISKDGEPKDTLGALWCITEEGVKFRVGSGPVLTKQNRKALWGQRVKLPLHRAVVKYQEKTDKGSIRFPVLVEIKE